MRRPLLEPTDNASQTLARNTALDWLISVKGTPALRRVCLVLARRSYKGPLFGREVGGDDDKKEQASGASHASVSFSHSASSATTAAVDGVI